MGVQSDYIIRAALILLISYFPENVSISLLRSATNPSRASLYRLLIVFFLFFLAVALGNVTDVTCSGNVNMVTSD